MEWKSVRMGQYQTDRSLREGAGLRVLREKEGCCILRCIFCRGKGTSRHGGGICLVCGGRGETILSGPIRKCVVCGGKGRGEGGGIDTTCLVCRGKGAVSVWDLYERCGACKGNGRRPGHKLPCSSCSGKGVVPSPR